VESDSSSHFLEQEGHQSEHYLGHIDAQEGNEENAQVFHGIRMRLEASEDNEHADEQKYGRYPIQPTEVWMFALADVLTVNIPIGQTHQ
jgi:hypothetical protein